MADAVTDSGSSEANEKIGPGGKKGKKNQNQKWYLVGGLAVIAVLVFFFVSRSKSNAANSASATPTGTTSGMIDPNTLATLAAAGLLGGSAASGSSGLTGPAGATGPAGPAGPAGSTGPQGPAGPTGATPSPPTHTNPGGTIQIPHTTTTYSSYTVKAGDTLQGLANRFGIGLTQLAHANVYVAGEVPGNAKVGQQLGTGAGLKTGQVLKIPHVSAAK